MTKADDIIEQAQKVVQAAEDLADMAANMPTQRSIGPAVEPAPKAKQEQVTQFSLSLRKSLRKQIANLAADSDMTMRAFVLLALKEKGLAVRDDDLADHRKTA
jgi:hypothetical protein